MATEFLCKYTEKELAALEEKAMNPQKAVICPRCGKELTFFRVGNSYEVNCPTKGCLHEAVRGL